MTIDPLAGGIGALGFLLFAALLTVSGTGALALMGCRKRLPSPIFLAPTVALALWVIALSGAAWLRLPIARVIPWLWQGTLALSVLGLFALARAIGVLGAAEPRPRARAAEPAGLALAALCLILPLVALPGVLLYGLADFAGSNVPDAWSYVAFADYLLFEPRGAKAGLSVLHQYGAHLADSRNAASALLAFLSSAVPGGRPDTAVNLFCLITLFAFAGAVVHFGMAMFKGRTAPTVAFLLLSVTGWPGDIIFAGNFDQLLVLPLFPALAAVAAGIGERRDFWRLTLLAALLIATAVYVYVELAGLGIVVAASLWLHGNGRLRSRLARAAASILLAAAAAAVLLLPAAETLTDYLLNQFAQGTQAAGRPGEGLFPGLADRRFALSALWALGGEYHLGQHYVSEGYVVAAALTGCALWGAWKLRREPLPALAAAGVLALYVDVAFRNHYPYGAYKILSVDFWLLAWLAVTGGEALVKDKNWKLSRRPYVPAVGVVLAAVLVSAIALRFVTVVTVNQFADVAQTPRLARDAAAAVTQIADGAPVLVSVTDGAANEWAVYQLSALPMRVFPYRAYMAQGHLRPYLAAARPIEWSKLAYVLTDRAGVPVPAAVAGGRIVWQNPLYALWQVPPERWAKIAEVSNPSGLEIRDGHPFVGLGDGPTRFEIVAGSAGDAVLTATVERGPEAAPDTEAWPVAVTAGAWRTETALAPPRMRIRVPLQAGVTTVTLIPLATPTLPAPKDGDTRPLLVGLADYAIELVGP